MLGVRAAKRLMITGSAVVVLGGLPAGCGHSARVGPGRTLQVALTEYQVVPQRVQVSAGQLTIVVHNDGKLAHNLAISSDRTSNLVQETPPIWPGTSQQLVLDLAPGSYTISSTLFSDQALGEYGSLIVR
jgi:hypothetical protein